MGTIHFILYITFTRVRTRIHGPVLERHCGSRCGGAGNGDGCISWSGLRANRSWRARIIVKLNRVVNGSLAFCETSRSNSLIIIKRWRRLVPCSSNPMLCRSVLFFATGSRGTRRCAGGDMVDDSSFLLAPLDDHASEAVIKSCRRLVRDDDT